MKITYVDSIHGRSAECAEIDRLLGRLRGGAGGTLMILGPTGIGKTTLLGHARVRRGLRSDTGAPHRRHRLRGRTALRGPAHDRPAAPRSRRVAPRPAGRGHPAHPRPDARSGRRDGRVRPVPGRARPGELLSRLAESAPAVCLVDDAPLAGPRLGPSPALRGPQAGRGAGRAAVGGLHGRRRLDGIGPADTTTSRTGPRGGPRSPRRASNVAVGGLDAARYRLAVLQGDAAGLPASGRTDVLLGPWRPVPSAWPTWWPAGPRRLSNASKRRWTKAPHGLARWASRMLTMSRRRSPPAVPN